MFKFDDTQFDSIALFRVFLISFFTACLLLIINQHLTLDDSSDTIIDVVIMVADLYYRYVILLAGVVVVYYLSLIVKIKIFMVIVSMLKLMAHMLVLHFSIGMAYIVFGHHFEQSGGDNAFPYAPDLHGISVKLNQEANIESLTSMVTFAVLIIICVILEILERKPDKLEVPLLAARKAGSSHMPRIFYDQPPTARADVLEPMHNEAERILRYIDYAYNPDTHLKLAVTAPWGTGKSTLINYVADKASAPTVKISITLGDTHESIITHFYDELYEVFEQHHIKPDQTLYQYMESVLWIIAQYKDNSLPEYSNTHNAYSESKEKLNNQIAKLLKDEKKEYMLIIIDDVDRVCYSEMDIKKVFTFINELLSFKNCVSIYSFAPSKDVKLQSTFLDKYINRNFNLEYLRPSEANMNQYIDKLFRAFSKAGADTQQDASPVLYTIKNRYYQFARRIFGEMSELARQEDLTAYLSDPARKDFMASIPEIIDGLYYNFRKIKAFMSEAIFVLSPAQNIDREEEQPETEVEEAYNVFAILFMCLLFNEETRILCKDMDMMQCLHGEHELLAHILKPYYDKLTPQSQALLNPPEKTF